MIDHLDLSNFRAFKDQDFRFGKLNIFVGPNNSGKSSALSAINVLAQTVNKTATGGGPLVLNGEFDQLGTFKDMVHGGRANTRSKIEFSLGVYDCLLDFKYRTQRREVELSHFFLRQDGKSVCEFVQGKDRFDIKLDGKNFEALLPGVRKRRPRFDGFVPIISTYQFRRDVDAALGAIPEEMTRKLIETERSIMRFARRLKDFFYTYESLSPFRVQPERTYLFSGETADRVGRNGQNAVTMLANDSSKRGNERVGYVDIISEWLERTKISGGLQVKHLTERHFEVAVRGKDGSDHNIVDVGFGVSQVLPVLISGINFAANSSPRRGGALVVQEPEIHLHPNAQAELGSFFVEIARSSGQVFLETHSDTLVLRVARHVANGDISPEDVTVFFVEDSASGRQVKEVSIRDDGTFFTDWPGDFFPQRQLESLELARTVSRGAKGQRDDQLNLFSFGRR